MRLGREELDVLHAIEDEAIALCRLPDGRIDHVSAALRRRDELAALESAGHAWAATVRDSAELGGHRKAISRRLKSKVITIPVPIGAVTMPSTYSRRRKDGSQQMSAPGRRPGANARWTWFRRRAGDQASPVAAALAATAARASRGRPP